MNESERILVRLVIPIVLVGLLILNVMLYSQASITTTRSMRAYFDITANSEYTTMILFAMLLYLLFAPPVLALIFKSDQIQIASGQNTLLVTSGGTTQTVTIPTRSYKSFELLDEINKDLQASQIRIHYDWGMKKFRFQSVAEFTMEAGSNLLEILGWSDSSVAYKAVLMNPLQAEYSITAAPCSVYTLDAPNRRFINLPIRSQLFLNPLNNRFYRPLVNLLFCIFFLIWKVRVVTKFRNVGMTLMGDIITDHQVAILNGIRVFYNQVAIGLALLMFGYMIWLALTGQDLTPYQDLHIS